jgi:hypothetical protein
MSPASPFLPGPASVILYLYGGHPVAESTYAD